MATETISVELETLDEHQSTAIANSQAQSEDQSPPGVASKYLPNNVAIAVIAQLAGINLLTSFAGGLITVGLPTIAADLQLPQNLLVWPVSVFYLTSCSTLLLAGSLADVIGARTCNLIGCFFLATFVLACGTAETGIQLIMFRAMQGIASAFAVPTGISIVSTSVRSGRPRNIAFGTLGLAQPLGFSLGLILGGLIISRVGWRVGYYIGGAASFLLFVVGIWILPADHVPGQQRDLLLPRLMQEPDWVGGCLASASIAIFSYVLAVLSADVSNIKQATNIALLALSAVLLAGFFYWAGEQERRGKPALIPNSIWRKTKFTTICVMIMCSNAVLNCMELLSSLFFQEVQLLSPVDASIRIIPNIIAGLFINLGTGAFVDRVNVFYAVIGSCILSACAPLLLAVINPAWSYWYAAFWTQFLTPVSGDVLFTVGIIVVSDVFPAKTQALAGAVFNMMSQLGVSIGLASTSVVSSSVTARSAEVEKGSPEALMEGYRAASWMLFGLAILIVFVGGAGLRKLGKVGEKRD